MAAGWRQLKAAVLAVCLCLSLMLTACSGGGPLTGNYVEDTVAVADTLIATIALLPLQIEILNLYNF